MNSTFTGRLLENDMPIQVACANSHFGYFRLIMGCCGASLLVKTTNKKIAQFLMTRGAKKVGNVYRIRVDQYLGHYLYTGVFFSRLFELMNSIVMEKETCVDTSDNYLLAA